MHYEFEPMGVCTKLITFDINDGRLHDVHFLGGCPGNLAAISKLIEGADPESIANILRGNKCGRRPTSCADQLATAIDEALATRAERAS